MGWYFELFGLSVLDVVGLVDTLLLNACFSVLVRDRTGAFWVGGGLGGIALSYIYQIEVIISKRQIPFT